MREAAAARRSVHPAWAGPDALRHLTVTPDALRAIAAVGALAGSPEDPTVLAGRALDALADLVPSDSAVLAAWDPGARRHRPLAAVDPPDADLGDGPDPLDADPGFRFVRDGRVPLRRCDVPGAAGNRLVVALEAAGYGEGVTACLFEGDRYVGALNLAMAGDAPATADAMALLCLVLEPLAALVDPTRCARAAAAALEPGAPAVLLRAAGDPEPLPGRPASPLLAAGSPVLRAARERAPRTPGALAFLWAAPEELWRVVAARLAGGDVLVALRPASTPLTRRELEVLTALTGGHANPAIAAALGISPHTVARHVEHVLDKLGVRGRTEAAACAVREGLLLA